MNVGRQFDGVRGGLTGDERRPALTSATNAALFALAVGFALVVVARLWTTGEK